MMKDVSRWQHIGHGSDSTLEKEELKSPSGSKYIIKYPRANDLGMYWEDIIELIAAEIGTIFGLEMMKVDIVIRNGKRGCLLRNFVDEYHVKMHAEGGELLSGLVEGYNELQLSNFKNDDLIDAGFKVLTKLSYWTEIKDTFIDMLIFDILIGNQDRHPYNWKILYYDTKYDFSPIYDNGASLGFHFNDEQLQNMLTDSIKLKKYVKKTQVRAGMFEKKKVKARDLLNYIRINFPSEFNGSMKKLHSFNVERYKHFIQSLDILSNVQKEWLLMIIPFRLNKIIEWVKKEEDNHE